MNSFAAWVEANLPQKSNLITVFGEYTRYEKKLTPLSIYLESI
jgi:hypothetical protein